MRRLELKFVENAWRTTFLESFGVTSKYANKVQGGTVIDGKMYLTESQAIRRCDLMGSGTRLLDSSSRLPTMAMATNRTIGNCVAQCTIDLSKSCSTSQNLVLQDAEVDNAGYLYIGSEFNCNGKPFFELRGMKAAAAACPTSCTQKPCSSY